MAHEGWLEYWPEPLTLHDGAVLEREQRALADLGLAEPDAAVALGNLERSNVDVGLLDLELPPEFDGVGGFLSLAFFADAATAGRAGEDMAAVAEVFRR